MSTGLEAWMIRMGNGERMYIKGEDIETNPKLNA
jgi:hypothetical protein